MTVGNPENFKVKITTGRDEVDTRKPCDFSNLNIKKLCAWIDNQPVNSTLKSELKRSACSYPHQALSNWKKNFTKHVDRIQNKLNQQKFATQSAVKKNVDVQTDVEMKSAVETNANTEVVVKTNIETQSTVETNVDAQPVVKTDVEIQSVTSQMSGSTNVSSVCSPQGVSQCEFESNLEVSQKAPVNEEFE